MLFFIMYKKTRTYDTHKLLLKSTYGVWGSPINYSWNPHTTHVCELLNPVYTYLVQSHIRYTYGPHTIHIRPTYDTFVVHPKKEKDSREIHNFGDGPIFVRQCFPAPRYSGPRTHLIHKRITYPFDRARNRFYFCVHARNNTH